MLARLHIFLLQVLQISLAGGLLAKIDKSKEIRINDRFFLGGPLTLRGFNLNGVGPHADGNLFLLTMILFNISKED